MLVGAGACFLFISTQHARCSLEAGRVPDDIIFFRATIAVKQLQDPDPSIHSFLFLHTGTSEHVIHTPHAGGYRISCSSAVVCSSWCVPRSMTERGTATEKGRGKL